MANDTYTAEQRQRSAEIARQKAEEARRAKLKRIAEVLAKNSELKRKMQEAQ